MKSCCIQAPSMMEVPNQKDPSPSSKPPQDIALLKFFLLLQVTGERKAEIEKLLHGAVGLKPHKFSKSSPEEDKQSQVPSAAAAAAAESADHSKTSSKRPSLTRRWRKPSLKKKSSEEDHVISSSKTSSSSLPPSASSSTASSTTSSFKSVRSSSPPSQDDQIPNTNTHSVAANGCINFNMDTNDATFTSNGSENDMSMLQRLALNALNLTAPASSVLLNNRRNNWIQLAGHPGSLAPAGPGTIWKKRGPDPVETQAYEALAKDPAREITPTFFREIRYQDEYFIEMADLLYSFHNPCVMDIKMGTRTFLETEVSNTTARHDLYEKMIKVDASAPSIQEHEAQAVTKLRYMDFRDNMSSSRSLGFRIEALKMSGSDAVNELQTVRSRDEVADVMIGFLKGRLSIKRQIIERLRHLRNVFVNSPFFQRHEVIGSSILIIYDDDKAGVWMIDFAKTVPLPSDVKVTHEEPWELGNHEEGYLTGIDNLIQIVEEVPATKTKKLGLFCTP